ncbi:Kinase [Rhynchospora pubera]|uniref:Kinase n=1 Tax=Rhynchospora pubera TaxID=906938 RepID=A0AAV8EB88_9POAL|nr:Kinase [Rhynchospora pubera]
MEPSYRTSILCFLLLSLFNFASSYYQPNVSYFIDCGATTLFITSDYPARNFTTETGFLSGSESMALTNSNNSTSSLYSTARVSSSKFKYTFKMVAQSSNVLRLHFFPFSAQTYNLFTARFDVYALNYYILLENFTVTNISSPTIKEFFLWTDSDELEVELSPKTKSYAFVSAIEVFTAPKELLNLSEPIPINSLALNGQVVKQVLETIHRVNMPGPLITPENDTLWRTWVTDVPYIYRANVSDENSTSTRPRFSQLEGRSEEIAPETVYKTARVINTSIDQIDSNPAFNVNVTWSFKVDSGYYYLIRLHFCDFISPTFNRDQGLVFALYIMDSLALPNNLRPAEHTDYVAEPFYLDFSTQVMNSQNITVSIGLDRIRSTINNAFLNGLEIMKVTVSNLDSLKKRRQSAAIIGASIGSVVLLAALVSCLVIALCKWCHKKPSPEATETTPIWSATIGLYSSDIPSKSGNTTTIGATPRIDLGLIISFSQIKMATNNFDEKNFIGMGGFGKVFKGVLANGTEVAVKRATYRSQQGLPEFQTEIEVLSQIRHRHLVSLIGYCDERSEMILVYEYMEKGPLRDYLYGKDLPSLSWKKRLEICINAAKGLHYLHTGLSQTIIHRDVKSTNILLGEGFAAKVSDFGLSKFGNSLGETHFSTNVKGTFGYLDPEYLKTQKLTDKSDVYSFGVVLLEVLCARPVIDQSLAGEEINLAEWALMWKRRGQLEKIVDQRLVREINEKSLRKFCETAEKCLQEYGIDRPSMGDVLWNLEYCLQLQEMEVRSEPYEDSATSVAHITEVRIVRRMPSSVSYESGSTTNKSQSDITSTNVFSQLFSNEGR